MTERCTCCNRYTAVTSEVRDMDTGAIVAIPHCHFCWIKCTSKLCVLEEVINAVKEAEHW